MDAEATAGRFEAARRWLSRHSTGGVHAEVGRTSAAHEAATVHALKAHFPGIAAYDRACVVSDFAHHVRVLLSEFPNIHVTWFITGPPGSMAAASALLREHGRRLRVVPMATAGGAPGIPMAASRALRSFRLVVADSAHFEPRAVAAFLHAVGRVLAGSPGADCMAYAMAPLLRGASPSLSAAWETLVSAAGSSAFVGGLTELQFCKWRAVLKDVRMGGSRRATGPGIRGAGEIVAAASIAAHVQLTDHIRVTYRRAEPLPRALWKTPPRIADRVYIPELLSSSAITASPHEERPEPETRPSESRSRQADHRPGCHWSYLEHVVALTDFLCRRRVGRPTGGRARVLLVSVPAMEHAAVRQLLRDMFPEVSRWASVRGGATDADIREVRRALDAASEDELLFFAGEARDGEQARTFARWGMFLGARAMSLPLLLPRVDGQDGFAPSGHGPGYFVMSGGAGGKPRARTEDGRLPGASCSEGVLDVGGEGGFLFPRGGIVRLPFCSFAENEGRVVCEAEGGAFKLAAYDPVMFALCARDFNGRVRIKGDLYAYLPAEPPLALAPGHDRSWDCMRYFEVALAYVESAGGGRGGGRGAEAPDRAARGREAARLMRRIDEGLAEATGDTLLGCTLRTWRAKLRALPRDDKLGRAVVALWLRLWRVRLSDYATVMREQLRAGGAAVFGAAAVRRMLAELDAAAGPGASGG